MRKTILALPWILAVAVLCLARPAAAADAKGVLDGKTFVGETGEKGGKTGAAKTEKDTLHFANGKFHSVACDPYGFTEAPYTATTAADGSVQWTSEATSSKEGKILWKGTVKGDSLTGTFTWTKAGQAPIEYWVKAAAQK
jgi:hypothetical protein